MNEMKKGTIVNKSDKIVGFYELLPNGQYYMQFYSDKQSVSKSALEKFAEVMEFNLEEDEGLVIE